MQTKPRKKRKRADHSGSSLDSFLEQEGIREEVEAVANKRVLDWQLERSPKEAAPSKRT
jgi:antitoxin HicB